MGEENGVGEAGTGRESDITKPKIKQNLGGGAKSSQSSS
jgi:hypothetical protein